MNNRLNMQDLARLLAEHSGKDRETIERFLKEFVAVVTEGVYTDKSVKIKGLGVFKIILVEKRESIHVNTGERFLIPAHYKFSFLPDKDLREQVNKPFSFFETTEIGENVNFSDMDESVEEKDTEDESVEEVMPDREIPLIDTITVPDVEPQAEPEPEIESISETGLTVEEELTTEPEQSTGPEPQPELTNDPVLETPSGLEPEVIEGLDREPEPEKVSEPAPTSETKLESEIKPLSEPVKPVSRKLIHKGTYLGIAAVIIVLICSAIIYIGKDQLQKVPARPVVVQAQDSVASVGTYVQKDSVAVIPDSVEVRTSNEAPKPKVLDTVKIAGGDRLTVIALKYYGNKLFWVYLYRHNQSRIKDPNNVPIGTVIEVPAPELYGIDSNSRESRDKAAALQTEILTGK